MVGNRHDKILCKRIRQIVTDYHSILDWHSKKVVRYILDIRCLAKEWIAALEMAVLNQCPEGSRTHDVQLMNDN